MPSIYSTTGLEEKMVRALPVDERTTGALDMGVILVDQSYDSELLTQRLVVMASKEAMSLDELREKTNELPSLSEMVVKDRHATA